MQMKSVFSSHIAKVGYDEASQELHVEFQQKGQKAAQTAVYSGVPPDVAKMVVDAPSVGSALHELIKGKYAHGYRSNG